MFKSTSPIVDKDEARAGVLGYHPLALLVVALDHIEKVEKQEEIMTVNELIKKLSNLPGDAQVWMQDAGDPYYGSELTGCMGCDYAEAEDVREVRTSEGRRKSKNPCAARQQAENIN